MPEITIKELLEAGIHFGHKTKRWNPKMKEYIFGERNGIYIIDLQKTLREARRAFKFITEVAARGGTVMFVGTKRQAKEVIRSCAESCGMPYVNERWLGGTLTNMQTVIKSLNKLRELERMEEAGEIDSRSKKEAARMRRVKAKLERNLSGIRNMGDTPAAIFIVDTKKERIALMEAKRLKIPIVGMVDTLSDPYAVDYPIPSNDDAIKSIRLIAMKVAECVVEGRPAVAEQSVVEGRPAVAEPVGSKEKEKVVEEEAAPEAGEADSPAETPSDDPSPASDKVSGE